MIVVAIIGIYVALAVPAELSVQRAAESEIGLQRALQFLRNEVEVLRTTPVQEFAAGSTLGFDPRAGDLSELVEGKGEVAVERLPDRPGLLRLTVSVQWQDARVGTRSIHTVVFKAF
jgi:type II secretory pathway pseudopilin PulG